MTDDWIRIEYKEHKFTVMTTQQYLNGISGPNAGDFLESLGAGTVIRNTQLYAVLVAVLEREKPEGMTIS